MESSEHQPLFIRRDGSHDNHTGSNLETSFGEKIDNEYVETENTSRSNGDSLTSFQALMHFLKAYIITGYLTLPFAVKHAGLWAGSIGLLFMSCVTLLSVQTIVHCSQTLCKRLDKELLDYPETMEGCFSLGPMCLRSCASKGRMVVYVVLFLLTFGVCLVYLSLFAAYFKQLLDTTIFAAVNIRVFLVICMILLVPIFFIKNLRILAPLSMLANIANCAALIIVFQYILTDLPNPNTRPSVTSTSGIFMFIGDSLFAFEGVGLVLALENRMKRPPMYPCVAGVGTGIVITLYVLTAFFGYLKFGDKTQSSIILNLPTNQWLYISVKLMAVVNLYVSTAVTMYVPIHLVWDRWQMYLSCDSKIHRYGEFIVRFMLLFVLGILTIAIPKVDMLVLLVGSFCGSFLTFVFPPVMRILLTVSPENVFKESNLKRRLMLVTYLIMFIIGLFCVIIGVFVSLRQIINTFICWTTNS